MFNMCAGRIQSFSHASFNLPLQMNSVSKQKLWFFSGWVCISISGGKVTDMEYFNEHKHLEQQFDRFYFIQTVYIRALLISVF